MTLHAGEYQIDVHLVTRLISDQMPQWADLPVRQVDSSGTVNLMYRLGDDKVVRLPRAPHLSRSPQRESQLLPRFSSNLPLRVPAYLALGTPSEEYPSHWSVLEWIDGTTADVSTLDDLDEAAASLGKFVVALQRVSTEGAPEGGNYRAFGLTEVDADMRRWVRQLPDEFNQDVVLEVWESCLAAGEWNGPPRWLHSDLRGDNLIARNGQLCAVIDWEGCTVGDPSADYLAAWWLFDADSREIFRREAEADQAGWNRGKAWALHMAVAAIPYYSATNPRFAEQARVALGEVVADS